MERVESGAENVRHTQAILLLSVNDAIRNAFIQNFGRSAREIERLKNSLDNMQVELKRLRADYDLLLPQVQLMARRFDTDPGEVLIETPDLHTEWQNQLAANFEAKNWKRVWKYLMLNYDLIDVVLEARERIDQYFGPDSRSFLDVHDDPDGDGSEELFIGIMTTLSPQEALERIDNMDREWWLDVFPNTNGKIVIDVSY